jgi:hypothetical protein
VTDNWPQFTITDEAGRVEATVDVYPIGPSLTPQGYEVTAVELT